MEERYFFYADNFKILLEEKSHDVLFLAPCEIHLSKRAFYDSIAKKVEDLGKTIFLPYKNIENLNGAAAVICPTELIICYSGIQCPVARALAHIGIRHGVSLIYFHDSNIGASRDFWPAITLTKTIEFSDEEEAIERIEHSVKDFFSKINRMRAPAQKS
ncbi:hypothetical protein HYV50_04870 [Candidatus Pacearchaeota archaeon]|nr:hypothetical protein [Candidatus Pacearchaeota archaeon]